MNFLYNIYKISFANTPGTAHVQLPNFSYDYVCQLWIGNILFLIQRMNSICVLFF